MKILGLATGSHPLPAPPNFKGGFFREKECSFGTALTLRWFATMQGSLEGPQYPAGQAQIRRLHSLTPPGRGGHWIVYLRAFRAAIFQVRVPGGAGKLRGAARGDSRHARHI